MASLGHNELMLLYNIFGMGDSYLLSMWINNILSKKNGCFPFIYSPQTQNLGSLFKYIGWYKQYQYELIKYGQKTCLPPIYLFTSHYEA